MQPRVQLAVDELLAAVASIPNPGSARLLIGSATHLQPEEWEAHIRSREITVRGDDRGLAYALSALRRIILLQQAIPNSLSIKRAPYFKVRRWSTAVSHCFGPPWDERIRLAKRLAYIKSDVIRRAADSG